MTLAPLGAVLLVPDGPPSTPLAAAGGLVATSPAGDALRRRTRR